MAKTRFVFSKTGDIRFISHLDTMRTITRSFTRAGLTPKYSEGFNPHAQLSIALPLSVGSESLCEILDIELDGELDEKTAPARLNPFFPAGLIATDAYSAERKPSEIAWIGVMIKIMYEKKPKDEILSAFSAYLSSESIIIIKKTKRGSAETDIVPMMRDVRVSEGDDNSIVITLKVSAQNPALNPAYVVKALGEKFPQLISDRHIIKRLELFDRDMCVFR